MLLAFDSFVIEFFKKREDFIKKKIKKHKFQAAELQFYKYDDVLLNNPNELDFYKPVDGSVSGQRSRTAGGKATKDVWKDENASVFW